MDKIKQRLADLEERIRKEKRKFLDSLPKCSVRSTSILDLCEMSILLEEYNTCENHDRENLLYLAEVCKQAINVSDRVIWLYNELIKAQPFFPDDELAARTMWMTETSHYLVQETKIKFLKAYVILSTNLAAVYFRLGMQKEAMVQLDEIKTTAPNSPYVYDIAHTIYEAQGDVEKSQAALQKHHELRDQPVQFWFSQ